MVYNYSTYFHQHLINGLESYVLFNWNLDLDLDNVGLCLYLTSVLFCLSIIIDDNLKLMLIGIFRFVVHTTNNLISFRYHQEVFPIEQSKNKHCSYDLLLRLIFNCECFPFLSFSFNLVILKYFRSCCFFMSQFCRHLWWQVPTKIKISSTKYPTIQHQVSLLYSEDAKYSFP
jgi:hypothetical protein